MARKLSKTKRFEVFKRDSFTCQYCGRTPPAAVLQVDHVLAVSKGGGNEDENLITACADCNQGKAANPMDRTMAPVNLDTARRLERLEQLKAFETLKAKEVAAEESRLSEVLEYWAGKEGQDMTLDTYRYNTQVEKSARRFLAKLALPEIKHAIDLAFLRVPDEYDRFKYFCAVCWHKIRGDLPHLKGNPNVREAVQPNP